MIKVKNTIEVLDAVPAAKDTIGKTYVAGKLVLLERSITSAVHRPLDSVFIINHRYHVPVIISETEQYEKGDLCLIYRLPTTEYVIEQYESQVNSVIKKIVALPGHFTYLQLQDIVSGKLEAGDTVMVECESTCDFIISNEAIAEVYAVRRAGEGADYQEEYKYKLDELGGDNRYMAIKEPLTLHVGVIEPTWNDMSLEILKVLEEGDYGITPKWRNLMEYLRKNYHPPKRK